MLLQKINVNTTVYVPIEIAWNLYTQAEHIQKWNFASNDWYCPAAENNFTVGGNFKYTMAAKDHSTQFDFEGKYTSITEFENLEYEIADGRKVSVDFTKTTSGTLISVSFDPEEQNSIEMQKNGWQAILDNFKSYAEEH